MWELCGAVRGGWEPREFLALVSSDPRTLALPPHWLFLFFFVFFLPQVVLDLLGSSRPMSLGPAWMMLPAGQSVLVVARGIQWAQTRRCLTIPTRNMKEQPPSNVCFPFPQGLGTTSAMSSFESCSQGRWKKETSDQPAWSLLVPTPQRQLLGSVTHSAVRTAGVLEAQSVDCPPLCLPETG